jgi:hypothetical protein
MDLLDRYLQAVKKHLPSKRQDDIIAELRANLESQLEDKEAELHRPLTLGEAEAWLKQLGSPFKVAMRYQPQQYLIGPVVFPLYLYVMRLALTWAAIVSTIVSVITFVLGPADVTALVAAIFRLPSVLIQTAAWVTVVFAAFEFFAARYPDKCPPIPGFDANWSPSSLPPLEPAPAPGRKRRSYSQAVAEVIFGFIFLAWLVVVPKHPFLMFGPGAAILHASPYLLVPEWITFYWWCVGLNAMQLAWICIDLLRGSWQQPGRSRHIAMSAFSLLPLLLLTNIRGHIYVLLRHPELDLSRYGQTVDSINHWVHLSLEILCVIVVLSLVGEVVRMFQDTWQGRSAGR